jgi:hypothetical protein
MIHLALEKSQFKAFSSTARRRKTPSQAESAREGLPNPASVIGEQALDSPKGRKYTILTTTEDDGSGCLQATQRKRRTRKLSLRVQQHL